MDIAVEEHVQQQAIHQAPAYLFSRANKAYSVADLAGLSCSKN